MTFEDRPPPPVFGIAGYKNSGKTTLIVALIEEFRRRGFRVASIKHAHHNFQIDNDETDSARHRRAGAGQVAIVSSRRWAVVTELDNVAEPTLDEVLIQLAQHRPEHDLVLVEGYKAEHVPKIECRRSDRGPPRPLANDDPNVVAIASDDKESTSTVPVFLLNDVAAIADFIQATLRLPKRKDGP